MEREYFDVIRVTLTTENDYDASELNEVIDEAEGSLRRPAKGYSEIVSTCLDEQDAKKEIKKWYTLTSTSNSDSTECPCEVLVDGELFKKSKNNKGFCYVVMYYAPIYIENEELEVLEQRLSNKGQKLLRKIKLIKKLEYFAQEMTHWERDIYYSECSNHKNFMNLISYEIEEKVEEIFGDTRGFDLSIAPEDLMGDDDSELLDIEVQEEREKYYEKSLDHNFELLVKLSENIKKFVDVVEAEIIKS